MTTSFHHVNFFDFSSNKQPKTLYVTSLTKHKDKSTIIKKIKSFFNNEEDFLDINANIYIGKKPQGPRYTENNEIIPYSYVGDSQYFKKNLLKKTQMKKGGTNYSSKTTETQGQMLKKKEESYDVIDNKILSNIYSDIKYHTERNKESENKKLLKTLPNLIKIELENQEKNLNEYERLNKNSTSVENYLVKKTKKKNKEELLISSIDSYLFKKAVLNTIEKKTPKEVKLGDNNFYFNLRRPKNFRGNRDCYINIGTNEKPFWGRFFEKSPNVILKCRKPEINEHYIKTFRKNPYLPTISNCENIINEIEIMGSLQIKGKKLIDFEKEHEDKIPGKKKLYKRNQLETMKESKNLTVPEFEKYLNDITQNKVYGDDYNIREMYKSLTGKTPFMSASLSSKVF